MLHVRLRRVGTRSLGTGRQELHLDSRDIAHGEPLARSGLVSPRRRPHPASPSGLLTAPAQADQNVCHPCKLGLLDLRFIHVGLHILVVERVLLQLSRSFSWKSITPPSASRPKARSPFLLRGDGGAAVGLPWSPGPHLYSGPFTSKHYSGGLSLGAVHPSG